MSGPVVRIVRTFAATPAKVFEAWADADVAKRWWFKSPDNEIREIQLNFRVGGAFSVMEWTGSEHVDQFGRYMEIHFPSRLVFD